MKKHKLFLTAAFFLLTSAFLFAEEKDNKKNKTESSFSLQSNFSLQGGYNATSYKNYPLGKLEIDLVEAWFSKIGIASVLGATFGMNSDNTNLIYAQMICPGVNVSYAITKSLFVSAGITLLHSWYIFDENENAKSYVSVTSGTGSSTGSSGSGSSSGSVSASGEKVLGEVRTGAKTTLRTYGFSIPVRLRYAFTKNLSAVVEYDFSAHPWLPSNSAKDTNWIVENTMSAGIALSIPWSI